MSSSRYPASVLVLAFAAACNRHGGAAPPAPSEPSVVAGTHVEVSTEAIDNLSEGFKAAIAAAGPAVVSVYSTVNVEPPQGFGPEGDLFRRFFGGPGGPGIHPQQPFQRRGMGSGFIVDPEGYVVTNNHVVANASEVKVKLSDGRELLATVVGTDPETDVAVLKVEGSDLKFVELGTSKALEPGDWVLAIGNPFGLSETVSAGIVSAVGRGNVGLADYEDFIQTDAAVNPGNSGGPLVDLSGRVVGINTAIASRSGGYDGIAFAIPIDMAKSIVDQLRGGGRVIRAQIGVVISELTPELAASFSFTGKEGILIQDVVKGGPGEKSGLRGGDIITDMDGQPVTSVSEFRKDVAARAPGTTVELGLWRDAKQIRVKVELTERPGAAIAATTAGPSQLGVGLEDLTPRLRERLGTDAEKGAVITSVAPGSVADGAGIRPGDILEQVGDHDVTGAKDAADQIGKADLKKGVRLRIRRDDTRQYLFVKAP